MADLIIADFDNKIRVQFLMVCFRVFRGDAKGEEDISPTGLTRETE
jgi:hypothetical protein